MKSKKIKGNLAKGEPLDQEEKFGRALRSSQISPAQERIKEEKFGRALRSSQISPAQEKRRYLYKEKQI